MAYQKGTKIHPSLNKDMLITEQIHKDVDMKILKKIAYLYNHLIQDSKHSYDEYKYVKLNETDGLIIYITQVHYIEKDNDLNFVDNILWEYMFNNQAPTKKDMKRLNKIYNKLVEKYTKK